MTSGDEIQHHLLSVLVENKAGVLARVSGMFARRGFNIISLAVAPTEDERPAASPSPSTSPRRRSSRSPSSSSS
jgi:hypothetical protein